MSEVVVNTILWFMSHRIKLMPMEDLSEVVSDYFHCDKVKEAKQLLYNKIPESVRPQNLKRFIHRQAVVKTNRQLLLMPLISIFFCRPSKMSPLSLLQSLPQFLVNFLLWTFAA